MSHAFAFDRLAEALRIELGNRDLAGAESRRSEHGGKIGDVKNWRSVEIHSTLSVSHPIVEVVNVGQNIGVSHHNSLWLTSRATRVDKSQNRFRVVAYAGVEVASPLQDLLVEHPLPLQLHGGNW